MMKPNVKRIISQLVNNLDIPRSGKSLDEDDSWYLTVSNGSYQNVEIRISNHKTDINTWAFRQYRGQLPSTRISIVFRDNNYAGNVLLHEPVRRQTSVTEYVYDLTDGSTFSDKEIAMLTKAIRAAASGSFVDPLGVATESDVVGKYVAQNTTTTNNGDTVPSTKWNHGMDYSIEESKTNKNMKKNIVKINENTLRQIVAESVKKVLKEMIDDYPTAEFEGQEYTIDDELPQNAKVMVHLRGSIYAFQFYPNHGESLRDCLEQKGVIGDLVEWWMEH